MARGATTVAAALLAGCAAINPIEKTSSEGFMRSHEVSITRQVLIPGAPQAFFEFIAAEDVLTKVLTGYGPLTAVVKTSENTGPWTVAGSARLIHLADGNTVREQVTYFKPSKRFAYWVWEFGNPIISSLATGREANGLLPQLLAACWSPGYTPLPPKMLWPPFPVGHHANPVAGLHGRLS